MKIHIQIMVLFLILILATGCEEITQKKKVSNFELGKGKLIEEGNSYKAAKYLKKALNEKPDNNEARILLIIACRSSIEEGTAKTAGKQSEYEKIAKTELDKLNTENDIKDIIDVIRERNIIQKDATQVLVDKGEKAVKPSIYALKNYAPIYKPIIEVLTQIGEPALDELATTLKNPSTPHSIRLDITGIIGNMQTNKAVPVLKKLTKFSDESVKMEAFASLYERGEKQYTDEILAGLKSSNVEVRRSASRAMIYMNESPPIKALIKTLKDQDVQVRINALKAIGENPNVSTIEPLVALLKSDKLNTKIQKYEERLEELSHDLAKFEIRYEMDSEVFSEECKATEFDGSTKDFEEWTSLYNTFTNIRRPKDKLVIENNKVKNHIARALIKIGKAGHASDIATKLVNALKDEEEWKARLTIMRVLENEHIMNAIDEESEYKLWKHYQESENNKMVKRKITNLLNKLE